MLERPTYVPKKLVLPAEVLSVVARKFYTTPLVNNNVASVIEYYFSRPRADGGCALFDIS